MKTCNVCKRIFVTESDFFRRTSRFRICSRGHLYFNCSCDGTLMIPHGKYRWFDPRQVLPEGAAALWDTYKHLRDLPSMPAVCLEAQAALDRPDSDLAEIVQIIRTDPYFAARILAVADVARPKSSAPIRNLTEALAILGRKRVRELAALTGVSQMSFRTSAYTLPIHLKRSLLTGLITEHLCERSPERSSCDKDKLFVAGAMADVGKIVSAVAFPEATDSVYKHTQAVENPMTWVQAEKVESTVSHIALGELACAVWGLPPEALEACTSHNDPISLPEEKLQNREPYSIGDIVTFANVLGKYVIYESQLIQPDVLASCLTRHGLDQKKLEEIVSECRALFSQRVDDLVSRLSASAA